MFVNSTMVEVFEKVERAFKEDKPFVIYHRPEDDLVKGIFQNKDALYYTKDYQDSGFVFAPFNNKDPSIVFPLAESQLKSFQYSNHSIEFKQNELLSSSNSESLKTNHQKLVNDGIQFLKKNNYKKVVLSRKEIIYTKEFKIVDTFKKLLVSYNNAFVYCWFHPKVGLWLGATPETLLKADNTSFFTMALAGTQVYKKSGRNSSAANYEDVQWKGKEVKEQQFVTDFILEQLNVEVNVSKAYTVKAGNLLHLRTDISGKLSAQLSLKKIIDLLHPTPAVCGVPKLEAKDFILQNENYNRQFYTGFLGELNMEHQSNLFVNLRCMQILKNDVEIYVGGGITSESNSENEWEETVAKTKIMLKVL